MIVVIGSAESLEAKGIPCKRVGEGEGVVVRSRNGTRYECRIEVAEVEVVEEVLDERGTVEIELLRALVVVVGWTTVQITLELEEVVERDAEDDVVVALGGRALLRVTMSFDAEELDGGTEPTREVDGEWTEVDVFDGGTEDEATGVRKMSS